MEGWAWKAAVHRVGHDWATSLSLFTFMHWQPTPVFLPGESQGRESLVDFCLWVAQSRTWLKRLSSSSTTSIQILVRLRPHLRTSASAAQLWVTVSLIWVVQEPPVPSPCFHSCLPNSILNTFSVLNMFRVNILEQKPDYVTCLSQSLLLASFHLLSFN